MPNPDDLEQLEADWGSLPRSPIHHPGDHITYRLLGAEHTGVILWCQPPYVPGGRRVPVRYVVKRDGAEQPFPDLIMPGDVLPKVTDP